MVGAAGELGTVLARAKLYYPGFFFSPDGLIGSATLKESRSVEFAFARAARELGCLYGRRWVGRFRGTSRLPTTRSGSPRASAKAHTTAKSIERCSTPAGPSCTVAARATAAWATTRQMVSASTHFPRRGPHTRLARRTRAASRASRRPRGGARGGRRGQTASGRAGSTCRGRAR